MSLLCYVGLFGVVVCVAYIVGKRRGYRNQLGSIKFTMHILAVIMHIQCLTHVLQIHIKLLLPQPTAVNGNRLLNADERIIQIDEQGNNIRNVYNMLCYCHGR